jgi:hypothetical protein
LSDKSADCFPAIVGRAKAHGALVAANPGPRQLSARGQAFLENLTMIDILMLNRSVADLLVPSLVARRGEGGPALPLAPGEEPPALAARSRRRWFRDRGSRRTFARSASSARITLSSPTAHGRFRRVGAGNPVAPALHRFPNRPMIRSIVNLCFLDI